MSANSTPTTTPDGFNLFHSHANRAEQIQRQQVVYNDLLAFAQAIPAQEVAAVQVAYSFVNGARTVLDAMLALDEALSALEEADRELADEHAVATANRYNEDWINGQGPIANAFNMPVAPLGALQPTEREGLPFDAEFGCDLRDAGTLDAEAYFDMLADGETAHGMDVGSHYGCD